MSRPALTSQYLQQFLATAEALPYDLQRNFTLIRELDARTQEALRSIEQVLPAVTTQHLPPEEMIVMIRSIHDNFLKCLEFGDDKIQIATQSYEMVDRHIQRLDGDVDRVQNEAMDVGHFDTDSKKKRRNMKEPENDLNRMDGKSRSRNSQRPPSAGNKAKDNIRGSGSSSSASALNSTNKAGGAAGGSSSSGGGKNRVRSATDIDMPVDPNEPVYCTCHQVSYGEMIGCDNPDCTTEWFHFQCVGLQSKPKGKWYCPKCSDLKKKGLIK